jgi:hypothetical protein
MGVEVMKLLAGPWKAQHSHARGDRDVESTLWVIRRAVKKPDFIGTINTSFLDVWGGLLDVSSQGLRLSPCEWKSRPDLL